MARSIGSTTTYAYCMNLFAGMLGAFSDGTTAGLVPPQCGVHIRQRPPALAINRASALRNIIEMTAALFCNVQHTYGIVQCAILAFNTP